MHLFGERKIACILSVSQSEALSRFLQSAAVVKLQVCLGYFKYSNFSIFENNYLIKSLQSRTTTKVIDSTDDLEGWDDIDEEQQVGANKID